MAKPFAFGKAVEKAHFIGRERECERLEMNFTHGINTILMSPRRWGKTSIVKHIIEQIQSDNIVVVFMDIFACRNEYDFCNKFAAEILRQTGDRIDELKNLAGEFLTRLTPKISYSFDGGMNDWSLSLGITPKSHTPEEVYQLPQIIANKKNCNILVCIDEFQQIGNFTDSITIQKRMRTVWQHQHSVSYCLFGSKKHMMESLFQKRSYPFYKFGDIIPLRPIEEEKWIPYIQKGFAQEGKSIDDNLCRMICQKVKLHPSYIQQLSWLTLLNTKEVATEESLLSGYRDLVEENAPLFTSATEHLTSYQLNFLSALLAGVNTGLARTAVRDEYNLGTTTNVTRIINALTNAEIIDTTPEGIVIADPVMEQWLRTILQ